MKKDTLVAYHAGNRVMFANTDQGRIIWTRRESKDITEPWLPFATRFTLNEAQLIRSRFRGTGGVSLIGV